MDYNMMRLLGRIGKEVTNTIDSPLSKSPLNEDNSKSDYFYRQTESTRKDNSWENPCYKKEKDNDWENPCYRNRGQHSGFWSDMYKASQRRHQNDAKNENNYDDYDR